MRTPFIALVFIICLSPHAFGQNEVLCNLKGVNNLQFGQDARKIGEMDLFFLDIHYQLKNILGELISNGADTTEALARINRYLDYGFSDMDDFYGYYCTHNDEIAGYESEAHLKFYNLNLYRITYKIKYNVFDLFKKNLIKKYGNPSYDRETSGTWNCDEENIEIMLISSTGYTVLSYKDEDFGPTLEEQLEKLENY